MKPSNSNADATLTPIWQPALRQLSLVLAGRLHAKSTAALWTEARRLLQMHQPAELIVNAKDVCYCDGAGMALLVDLQRRTRADAMKMEILDLAEEYQRLLTAFRAEDFARLEAARPKPARLPEDIGRGAAQLWQDLMHLIAFVGELAYALLWALRHPSKLRWRDVWLTAESAGANALPIVALISFLIGVIMAFQSAVPMRKFGADIFVADLVALAMLRELGPLMTAIIFAGRSGSAFAAELGTMKVNEEINALTTMGLDPVRFLVVSRVLAVLLVTPLLTLFANLMGLVGGFVVMQLFGYPLVTYVNEILGVVRVSDLVGGLIKSVVFGLLAAGIGCLRGLQTKTGPSAVGVSTTRAVVSGIILIVAADAVFGIVYYGLGY